MRERVVCKPMLERTVIMHGAGGFSSAYEAYKHNRIKHNLILKLPMNFAFLIKEEIFKHF